MCRVFAENKDSVVYTTEQYKNNYDDYQRKSMTMDIVSKFGYIAGLNKSHYEKEENPIKISIFDELEKNKNAKIIRSLCRLRISFIRNFKAINDAMNLDTINIDKLNHLVDVEDINFLYENNIRIVKANYRLVNYIVDVNKLISDRINNCKDIFPMWVKWDYLKNMLIMPNGTKKEKIREASQVYTSNIVEYPYQLYISWKPEHGGGFMYNDKVFLETVYRHHGEYFDDYNKVTDAAVSTKKDIYDFLDEADKTILIVDCENSDPYKLYNAITSLDETNLGKISEIILVDDKNTTDSWERLENYLNYIKVNHCMTDRINDRKSLVDPTLYLAVTKHYYENNIKSFILCSSDSDFWPLMLGLEKAQFLVMMEYSKCGEDIIREMDNSGIMYCALDEFSDGNNSLKEKVIVEHIEDYLKEKMSFNMNNVLDDAIVKSRIKLSEGERKQLWNKYIKNMALKLYIDGGVEIKIA